MDQPLLHHDRIIAPDASPDRWMVLLHGIYGAARNWVSVARRFVRARPEWGVLTTDLRQHGRSPRFPGPHTLEAAAGDLVPMIDAAGVDVRAILGHSFGGKVALLYATRAPDPPEQVWVIDSTPATGEPSGSAWTMRRVLTEHPGPFASRAEAIAAVEALGFANPVAQWMALNAVPGDDGLRWRLDVADMEALLLDFFETDAWHVLERPPVGTDVHVVKGTESGVLDPEAVRRIREAEAIGERVHFHEVRGGHWLNADNPDALEELLVRHL